MCLLNLQYIYNHYQGISEILQDGVPFTCQSAMERIRSGASRVFVDNRWLLKSLGGCLKSRS